MVANSQPTSLKNLKILIVDDEDILAWSIETEFKSLGAETLTAGTVREALERFRTWSPDILISDLRLPDGNGMDLLNTWKHEKPNMPVILITAHGAVDSAISALRLGAFDYMQKPFDMKTLVAAVTRAAEVSRLRDKLSSFQGSSTSISELHIIGEHPKMKDLNKVLEKVAKSKVDTVLVQGESGSGKELAARALHLWSNRSAQPFVEINCASIPESLLESELFGYEKGAFTDARERKLGLFEIAKSGTIFLDEIGEMPLKIQAKLLRAIEYKKFKRLGGTKDVEINARIVAATNRNLLEEVANENFRADLFYRLNVINIDVPSLKERISDIPVLTKFLSGQLAKELEIKIPSISKSALSLLESHGWPGNVRELKNVLKRAFVIFEPEVLEERHLKLDPPLPAKSMQKQQKPIQHIGNYSGASKGEEDFNGDFSIPETGFSLDNLEKNLLIQALERSRNNQTRAARLLGISRHTLRYRLDKHGLLN